MPLRKILKVLEEEDLVTHVGDNTTYSLPLVWEHLISRCWNLSKTPFEGLVVIVSVVCVLVLRILEQYQGLL
jgi:hypothetical protein